MQKTEIIKENNIKNISMHDEMSSSYLSYAMSVIVSRALPDIRDGLKPVHRRILFAMYKGGYDWSKQFRKSARIVGDVIGKYHPHGDQSVYDALVRMVQDFSMSLPLVEGQGNFGSIDGDPAAAMRYTETRLAKVSQFLIDDIEKNTIQFKSNYDETEKEPSVLPAQYPNLLVNGAGGIAVGMATSIPPHNLGEIINGTLALIENKDILMYEENFFYKNWIEVKNSTTNKREKLISYNLALENIEDLEYINNIKNKIDLIDIKKINSFNGYENFVLLIIYSAEEKLKAFIKTSIKNINIDRNINLDFYSKDKKKTYKEAITTLKKEINQIWKEQNLIDVNTPTFLDFFLETKKLNDYLKLKLILDKIDVIENYSVLEMTNTHLKIRIKYRGKINQIRNKLIEQKINIKITDNVWKLNIK